MLTECKPFFFQNTTKDRMMHFNISVAVNRGRYDKQKDCRLSLLTKKKNMFFENIDPKIVSDN